MKNYQFLFIAMFSILTLISCNSRQEGDKIEAGDALNADSIGNSGIAYQVSTTESTLEWSGKKPTGEHFGSVNLSGGSLTLNGSEITGGTFTLDMNTITVLDLKDKGMIDKLTGHLKSEDFFNVSKFSQAEFEITSVEPVSPEATGDQQSAEIKPTHAITGNLKIKDIVKSISFKAQIDITDSFIEAKTPLFYINRTDWDIRYKSKKFFDQLKDDFINDEIGLKIVLKASKQ